jgi:hypothetical protein
MKITLNGYIVARQYDWDTKPRFEFIHYDPSDVAFDTTAVKVQAHFIEVDIPDNFDIRPFQIDKLRKEREQAAAEFAKRVKQIDDKINSLLAIENNPSGDAE